MYVDDILLTGNLESEIHKIKRFLDDKFTVKDLKYAKYFLGLELTRLGNGLWVNQRKYILDLLQDAALLGCKPATSPLPKGIKFCSTDGELLAEPQRYKRMVGKLLYLSFTRPDISCATQQLSQFIQAPRDSHWQGALHVLRYLKGCPSKGLFFPSEKTLCS